MTRNLQFFFAALLLSMPIWWGFDLTAQDMEEFFFAREMQNPEILAAYAARAALEEQVRQASPLPTIGRAKLELDAPAVFSLLKKEDGSAKVLFEKQSDAPLLIASLTKLITALTALQSYSPTQEVLLTKEILAEEGEAGLLKEGEVFTVKDLLHVMLMESSNDAAAALAAPLGKEEFVERMNKQARALSLSDTVFYNPTGLDPPGARQQGNSSSANDLAKLAAHVHDTYPQVFDILSQQELDLYAPNGSFHHTMKNTNALLQYKEWPSRVLGGKTGFTPQARETLLLLVESPDQKGYIINVLLGSEDRFGEMRRLLDWILASYRWNN